MWKSNEYPRILEILHSSKKMHIKHHSMHYVISLYMNNRFLVVIQKRFTEEVVVTVIYRREREGEYIEIHIDIHDAYGYTHTETLELDSSALHLFYSRRKAAYLRLSFHCSFKRI